MPRLFDPFTLRNVTLKNRIGVSPMCQYSAHEGMVTQWHMAHLGGFAKGGAGLVIMEATAVAPEGRITPFDTGLWNDAQMEALRPVVAFLETQGCVPGIQIAHAGRKAGHARPWDGGAQLPLDQGGWETVGPSPIAFSPQTRAPRPMTSQDARQLIDDFATAADRARKAGFKWLEIHAAHGYLLHSFLSPLSNHRQDQYGGDVTGRARLLLDVVRACHGTWGDEYPLTVRISASDWAPGGLTIDDSVAICHLLKRENVDLIDVSSGGTVPDARIPLTPGYQVPFATRIRRDTGLPTAAVGLITEPAFANELIEKEETDLVFLGRELLRDPHWPLKAARALGVPSPVPPQYARAF